MHQIKPTIFIFSPELATKTDAENYHRVEECVKLLKQKGLPFKTIDGYYKGKAEKAFLVVGEQYEATISALSAYFEQECYLKSDSERSTTLVYSDGSVSNIGKLTRVAKEVAKEFDAYTYDYSDGSYWVCKEVDSE